MSMKQLRYRVQHKPLNPCSTHSTKDITNLQKQLLLESSKTGTLKTFYSQLRCPSPANTRNTHQQNTDRGKRRSDAIQPAPPAATRATINQAQNTPVNEQPTKIRIKQCTTKITLFDEPKKNRRRTPKEMEDEILLASIFKRPVTPYIYDPPFYPWLPPTPLVNFDLNYKQ